MKNYTINKRNWSGESVNFKASDTRLICKEYDLDMTITHKLDPTNDGSDYDAESLIYTNDGVSHTAFKFLNEKKWTVLDDDFYNHTMSFQSECPHKAIVRLIANIG